MENSRQMRSPANPAQRLRNLLAKLVLEKIVENEISKRVSLLLGKLLKLKSSLLEQFITVKKRSSLLRLMLSKVFLLRRVIHWPLMRLRNYFFLQKSIPFRLILFVHALTVITQPPSCFCSLYLHQLLQP